MTARMSFCLQAVTTLDDATLNDLTSGIEAYVRSGLTERQAEEAVINDMLAAAAEDKAGLVDLMRAQHADLFKSDRPPLPEDPVLQNRNRSTPPAIAQMRQIAKAPDYTRLGFSRDFANGAPVVAGGSIPANQLGRKDTTATSEGRQIPVQYAVVESDQILASNTFDGRTNPGYADRNVKATRAIAGNGRIAGLQEAYAKGSADAYRAALMADDLHGVLHSVIMKMKAPILVRIMPESEITQDIGDVSNIASGLAMSPAEMARNDGRRLKLDSLQFTESGDVTPDSVRRFVQAMPPSEQGNLINTNGSPTKQAVDRLNNAIFAQAYDSDALIELYAQATDPEARNVMSALQQSAHAMFKLKGTEEFDIRGIVAQAAELAVNARRRGLSMKDAADQMDLGADPDTRAVLLLFAEHARSVKPVVEALVRAAEFAHAEASKGDVDMFGDVPRATRADVLNQLGAKNGRQGALDMEVPAGGVPADQNVEGPAAGPGEQAGSEGAAQAAQGAQRGQAEGLTPPKFTDYSGDRAQYLRDRILWSLQPGHHGPKLTAERIEGIEGDPEKVGSMVPAAEIKKALDSLVADGLIAKKYKSYTLTGAPKAEPKANTVFTEDAAAKARELLRKRLNGSQLNAGIDPEVIQAGITLAGYHIEKGARTFAAYSKAMLEDLGDMVRPYLKSWYMAAKHDPRLASYASEMDDEATVNAEKAPTPGEMIGAAAGRRTFDLDRAGLLEDAQEELDTDARSANPAKTSDEAYARYTNLSRSRIYDRDSEGPLEHAVNYLPEQEFKDMWRAKHRKETDELPAWPFPGQPTGSIEERYQGKAKGTQYHVIKNHEGYSVWMYDMDQPTYLPKLEQFEGDDALEEANAYAKSVASSEEPLAPEVPATKRLTPQANGITRAAAGGQFGVNGEWYEGGQILPGSEDTVKGENRVDIPPGYKASGEPYYSGGVLTQGYAVHAVGDRVKQKDGGYTGTVIGYTSGGPIFDKTLVKFDNGTESSVSGKDLEALQEAPPAPDVSVPVSPAAVLAGAGLVVEEKQSQKGKTYWAVSGNTLEHKATLDALGFAKPFRMGGTWYRSVFDANPTERLAAALQGSLPPPAEARPAVSSEEASPILRQYKVGVMRQGDAWIVTGKSFDIKDVIKSVGGRWNGEAWQFTGEDPSGTLAAALKERGSPGGVGNDPGLGESDAEIERRRELRKREDSRPDERADAGDVAEHVDSTTADLILRGKQFGIPEKVLREQIEDIGFIVNAHAKGKPLFLLANEAGTGKTLVLGGAIRELRARGETKFVYVTMNTDLIAQIKKDLAAYGLEGVSFHTYSELSGKAFDTQDAILIFDEAHNIKNVGGETARANKAQGLMEAAKMNILASATLFENPVELRYLASTGIFDVVGGFGEWAKTYGASVKVRKFYNPNTGRQETEEIIYWAGRGKKEDGAAARQWLFKQAIITQRAMTIDPKLVNVEFRRNAVAPEWTELYQTVADAYEAANDAWTDDNGNPRDAKIVSEIARHRENTIKRVLESAKTPFAIEEAKKLLAAGRNVVVFVETKADRHLGKWRRSENFKDDTLYTYEQMQQMMGEWRMMANMARAARERPPQRPFAEFIVEIARFFDAAGLDRELPSTADQIQAALGADNVAMYTGAVSNAAAGKNKADFMSGKKTVLVATMAKGGTGLSLHDTVGNRPTTQLNINLPWKATGVDQVSARVARYGLASAAEVRWLFASNIPWEANKLAPRVGARMRDMGALVKGIEVKAAEILDGNFDFEGDIDAKGGSAIAAGSDEARVDIYARAKRMDSMRRKADDTSHGFFETPYSLAALMANVSGVKVGHTLLEPSGGRGNLLRLLPEGVKITAVELREDNQAALSRLVPSAEVIHGDFMGTDIASRFDTVLMNPPFERVAGVGAQDVAHVQRAYDLLQPDGRMVAIMGEGAFFREYKQEEGFRDWLDDVGAVVIQLPEGAFKQSGTGVRTRMVVIDKAGTPGRTDINLSDLEPDSLRAIERQIPSRQGANDAAVPPGPVAEQERGVYAVHNPQSNYDLFPIPEAQRADLARRDQGAAAGNLPAPNALSLRQNPALPGIYHFSSQLVEVGRRELPVERVTNWGEAAAAISSISRYAVEHFDALVTDKDGKPLAIVGSFKGAQAQTSVYPGVLLAEALRIEGAAMVWGVHNHPSGMETLSRADLHLNGALIKTFDPSTVKYVGTAAIGGGRYEATDDSGGTVGGAILSGKTKMTIPVVERTIMPSNTGMPVIDSPSRLKDVMSQGITNGVPGILFVDSQHRVTAWVPVNPDTMGWLRKEGRFDRLINSASEAGAASAVIANPGGAIPDRSLVNMASALALGEVRVLDVIDTQAMTSAAEQGKNPARDAPVLDLDGLGFQTTQFADAIPDGKVESEDAQAVAKLEEALQKQPGGQSLSLEAAPRVSLSATGPNIARARAAAVTFMQQRFKKRVVFYRSNNPKVNGAYDPGQPGVIFVGEMTRRPLLAVLGHEVTHAMRRDRPDLYNEMAGSLSALMTGDAAFYDKLNAERKEAGMLALRADKSHEELVANIVGDFLDEPATLRALAEDNPGVFRRFVNYIVNWLDDIIAYATNSQPYGSKAYLNDVKAARAIVLTALRQYTGAPAETAAEAPSLSQETAGPFYSELARQLSLVQMKAGPAQSWYQAIKGLKGVKQSEIDWSGIHEWLGTQDGRITKDQVLGYLATNGVRLEETTHEWEPAPTAEKQKELDELNELVDLYRREQEGEEGVLDAADRARYKELIDKYPAGPERITPKYPNYQLPGGTNYREVLLRLPADVESPVVVKHPFGNGYALQYGDGSYVKSLEGGTSRARVGAENATSWETKNFAYAGVAAHDRASYRSRHWDQANVVVHIRLNDRTDADGKRVLFVEEIQSDWGQAGAKKKADGTRVGFHTKAAQATVQKHEASMKRVAEAIKALKKSLAADDNLGFDTSTEAADAVLRHSDYSDRWDLSPESTAAAKEAWSAFDESNRLEDILLEKKPPEAPFVTHTDAWAGLALKRIIKLAVDEGYDKVAFINGEQSAARYDLAKQVDGVMATPQKDGTFIIRIKPNGQDYRVLGRYSHEQLGDAIGKDLANKVVEDAPKNEYGAAQTYSGLDLKVGGEGMKAFYDKIIPTVAKDVLKKLGGAGFGAVNLARQAPVGKAMDDGAGGVVQRTVPAGWDVVETSTDPNDPPRSQPGFDITQGMRDSAADGVPMFSLDMERIRHPWLDPTNRLQFLPGKWLWEKLGKVAAPLLASRFVQMKMMSPELKHLTRQMKLKVQEAQDTAAAVAHEALKLSTEERNMVSDIIEQELRKGVVPPEYAVRLAASMSQAMGRQTRELVALQMISPEAAARWDGKYLPRFYTPKLGKQIDDVWTAAVRRIRGLPSPMRGIKGSHLKGRGMNKTVSANEVEHWGALGWEVRDPDYAGATPADIAAKVHNTLMNGDEPINMWRDYTRQEREKMGEERDAGFRFVMGYMQTQRDIALGQMFQGMASDPKMSSRLPTEHFTVKVPNSVVEDTGVKRYGMLAGRYVAQETMSHLSQIEDTQNAAWAAYRKAMGLWKEGKTVLNPATHMNNVLGNLTMAHLAGVSYHRVDAYFGAAKDLATGAPMVEQAKKDGLFLGTMSDTELAAMLPPELREIVGKGESALAKGAAGVFNIVMALGLRKPLQAAYKAEDTFFRYVVYRDAVRRGASGPEALDTAQSVIFTYDDLPKGARMVRDLGIPFFAWTYKLVPKLLETALVYPWRLGAPIAIGTIANAAAYAIAFGSDDDDWYERMKKYITDAQHRKFVQEQEKLEQANLPQWMRGSVWIPSSIGKLIGVTMPKAVRLGMDKVTGHPLFLDVSRIFPGGDIADVVPNVKGAIPLPQPLTPSHPILTMLSGLLANRDLWTGKDLVDLNDTTMESTANRTAWIWRNLSSGLAIGSANWERGMQAVAQASGGEIKFLPDWAGGAATGIGKDGLPVQPGLATLQTIGIKVRPINLGLSERIDQNERRKLIQGIEAELRSLARQRSLGAITDRQFEKEKDKGVAKIQNLAQGLTVSGNERD